MPIYKDTYRKPSKAADLNVSESNFVIIKDQAKLFMQMLKFGRKLNSLGSVCIPGLPLMSDEEYGYYVAEQFFKKHFPNSFDHSNEEENSGDSECEEEKGDEIVKREPPRLSHATGDDLDDGSDEECEEEEDEEDDEEDEDEESFDIAMLRIEIDGPGANMKDPSFQERVIECANQRAGVSSGLSYQMPNNLRDVIVTYDTGSSIKPNRGKMTLCYYFRDRTDASQANRGLASNSHGPMWPPNLQVHGIVKYEIFKRFIGSRKHIEIASPEKRKVVRKAFFLRVFMLKGGSLISSNQLQQRRDLLNKVVGDKKPLNFDAPFLWRGNVQDLIWTEFVFTTYSEAKRAQDTIKNLLEFDTCSFLYSVSKDKHREQKVSG